MTDIHEMDMDVQRSAAIAMALQSFHENDWTTATKALLNDEAEALYDGRLVEAETGMAHCGDERKGLNGEAFRKPKLFGGAAGWATYFMMFGMNLQEAVAATATLYEKRGWGQMEVHSDDHGCADSVEAQRQLSGCGFAGANNLIRMAAHQVLSHDEELVNAGITAGGQISGEDLIQALMNAGAVKVSLTGEHKGDEAHVIINKRKGMTIPTEELYDELPTFTWDAWATTDEDTLIAFSEISGKDLTSDQFTKIQSVVTFATGLALNVVRLHDSEGRGKNVVVLE